MDAALGTLISGVPILDAINVTRETAGNEVYANMLTACTTRFEQGNVGRGIPVTDARPLMDMINDVNELLDSDSDTL